MKLTHPFVLLGTLIALVVAGGVALEKNRTPRTLRTVQVQSTETTTSTIAIKADTDDAQLDAATIDLKARDRRWEDALKLAGSTARMQLAPVIKDMQDQLRSNESVALPGCLGEAKPYWIESQRETVSAFLAFMAQNEFTAAEHFKTAERATRNYTMVLDACRPAALRADNIS